MSSFQFGKIPPSSTTSPFSFATSSSPSPSPPLFSSTSFFGSSQPSTNPNPTFGAPTNPSLGFAAFANTSSPFSATLAPPAMSFGFGSSPDPASSTLYGSSAAGNATTSSPLGGFSLFGSSSRTDPLSNLFASTSAPTNSSNLFGTSSVSVNTSKLLGVKSGSGNVSGLFGSSKAPAAGSTSVFGSSSGSGITSSLFVSSSGSSNTSTLFGSSSAAGFGTASSPLFSTVTTTTGASTQATTTTTTTTTLSATPIPVIPAFGMTSSTDGKDALVAATESFPCFVTSSSAATSGTTSSVSGFLLSTETAGTAAPLQPHTSVASTLCRIPVWHGETFSRVGGSSWCSSALQKVDLNKEKEVNLGLSEGEIKQLKDIIRLLNIRMAEYQDKEICMGPLEGSKTHDIKVKVSEVKDGIESQLLLTVGQLPMVPHMKFLEGPGDTLPSEKLAAVERGLKSPHKEIFEGPPFFSSQLTNDNMFTWSSRNDLIIKQILDKYGDITSGSILKSTAAKSIFLSLVADVVERLCKHTLDTLDADELQLMEMQIADAEAVGFYVDWLRQRVDKIIAASKYKLHVKQLDELEKLIFAAKRSLMEMEQQQQQLILKKETSALKVEMQGDELSESNLVEGLL